MEFKHEKLDDGRIKVTCFDEDGCVLETRIFSKQTADLLSQADGSKGYEFGKSMWIPIKNTKTKNMKVYYTTEEGGTYKRLKNAKFVVITDDNDEIVANYDGIINKSRNINGKYFNQGITSILREHGVAKMSLHSIIAREKWIAFTHGLSHVLFSIKKIVLKPLSFIWIKFGRHGEDYAHGDCYGFMWFYHLPCCMIWRFYYRDFYCFIPKKHVPFFNNSDVEYNNTQTN